MRWRKQRGGLSQDEVSEKWETRATRVPFMYVRPITSQLKSKEFKCQLLNMPKQPSVTLVWETKSWQMLGAADALLIKSGRNTYAQHVPCQTVMTIWNNWGHTMWQCRGKITQGRLSPSLALQTSTGHGKWSERHGFRDDTAAAPIVTIIYYHFEISRLDPVSKCFYFTVRPATELNQHQGCGALILEGERSGKQN